ncbi:MAG: NAD(P)-dependent dehydrogenase (short-subunit alcohol dehydrogenase family) [Saprospiraceae bacterium]|jgi:NAD(P)-dependent dehydrogenase (short-subunit alcohol dehydrogenase family)
MSFLRLENKVVLVTGASSGIGAKTAVLLSQSGAKLILTGRNEEKLQETFSDLGGSGHLKISADLTNEEEIVKLIASLPKLDSVVHCAGIIKPFPIKYISYKQISEIFKINFDASVLLTAGLLKQKKVNHNASIVFMSSVSSQFAHKGGALYSASKAAINAFSKSIAIEYAAKKIRSNVISAAMVRTPIFDQAETSVTSEMMDLHEKEYPLGFGETEDVANAILFLLSDASRWITGTALTMDGGLTAGQ